MSRRISLIAIALVLAGTARAEVIHSEAGEAGYQVTMTAALPNGFAPGGTDPDTIFYSVRGISDCVLGFGRVQTNTIAHGLREQWLNSIAQMGAAFPITGVGEPQPGSNQGGTSFYIGIASVRTQSGDVPFLKLVAAGNRGGRAVATFFCADAAARAHLWDSVLQTMVSTTITLTPRASGQTYGRSNPTENMNRSNELRGNFIDNFRSRQQGW
jgi:hypothetical protein